MVGTGSRSGLITGRTAFQVTRWRHRATAVLVVVSLSIAYLSAAGVPQSLFTDLLIGLLLVSGFVLVVLINWAGFREDAEKRAGYTTIRLGNGGPPGASLARMGIPHRTASSKGLSCCQIARCSSRAQHGALGSLRPGPALFPRTWAARLYQAPIPIRVAGQRS